MWRWILHWWCRHPKWIVCTDETQIKINGSLCRVIKRYRYRCSRCGVFGADVLHNDDNIYGKES